MAGAVDPWSSAPIFVREGREPQMASIDGPDVERAHAAAAGLVHVCDSEAGLVRLRRGPGFSFRDRGGRALDAETLARVKSLAIPPAWREVWICPQPNGHIQATGRDARGRKQYLYHPAWRDFRDRHKFDHAVSFGKLLPKIRYRINADLGLRGMVREKVLATIVLLLDKTHIRVGNIEYARDNGSYGLTTLRTRHLAIAGTEVRFEFTGKSGRTWRLPVRDRRVALIVRRLQDLPGQHLFKYVDADGALSTVDSADVNAYLREISGADVSAKDFRTWAGTVLAAVALAALGPFETKVQAKAKLKAAIEAVATRLGNTPTICRKCYVHPAIPAAYLAGTLPAFEVDGDADTGLSSEERAVLRLLEREAKGQAAAENRPARSSDPVDIGAGQKSALTP